MTKLGLFLPAIALFAAAPGAHAARGINLHARTAGELARMCAANPSKPAADAAINYCHGFSQGVADSAIHFRPKAFCFPKPTPTRTETLDQFVHWVRAQPDREKLPAAAGLFNFLHERYPCGK